MSFEGSERNTYTNRSLVWSPDSKKLAVYRVVPGHAREVHYVESSPADQVQPKNTTLLYAKPGDVLFVPGADHGSGGEFGTRKRNDFFVKHLLGTEPPAWSACMGTDRSRSR